MSWTAELIEFAMKDLKSYMENPLPTLSKDRNDGELEIDLEYYWEICEDMGNAIKEIQEGRRNYQIARKELSNNEKTKFDEEFLQRINIHDSHVIERKAESYLEKLHEHVNAINKLIAKISVRRMEARRKILETRKSKNGTSTSSTISLHMPRRKNLPKQMRYPSHGKRTKQQKPASVETNGATVSMKMKVFACDKKEYSSSSSEDEPGNGYSSSSSEDEPGNGSSNSSSEDEPGNGSSNSSSEDEPGNGSSNSSSEDEAGNDVLTTFRNMKLESSSDQDANETKLESSSDEEANESPDYSSEEENEAKVECDEDEEEKEFDDHKYDVEDDEKEDYEDDGSDDRKDDVREDYGEDDRDDCESANDNYAGDNDEYEY